VALNARNAEPDIFDRFVELILEHLMFGKIGEKFAIQVDYLNDK